MPSKNAGRKPLARTDHFIRDCPPNAGSEPWPTEVRALLCGERDEGRGRAHPSCQSLPCRPHRDRRGRARRFGLHLGMRNHTAARPAPHRIDRRVDGRGSRSRRGPRELPAWSPTEQARRSRPLVRVRPTTASCQGCCSTLGCRVRRRYRARCPTQADQSCRAVTMCEHVPYRRMRGAPDASIGAAVERPNGCCDARSFCAGIAPRRSTDPCGVDDAPALCRSRSPPVRAKSDVE